MAIIPFTHTAADSSLSRIGHERDIFSRQGLTVTTPTGSAMRRVRSINPLLLGILGWCITLANLAVGQVFIHAFGFTLCVRILVGILIVITVSIPVISMIFLSNHYKSSSDSIKRIIMMYLGMLLICANANFNLVLHDPVVAHSPFSGIPPIWSSDPTELSQAQIWINIFTAAAYCLHLSISTLSTFNDGQIIPITWYAKLVIDMEVLMGLGITVLVVGRHFSWRFDVPTNHQTTETAETTQIDTRRSSVTMLRRHAS
ncbi:MULTISPECIES: hypothetical protein [unclassified Methylobacterium]|uniref:hypothetical protein n=1 Tax=unclassified Methylobacterium TaxID=2615210 RepID=UPI002269BDBA|nr:MULTISPECIES: hypothetical protein [unclassified Methylobacterium]